MKSTASSHSIRAHFSPRSGLAAAVTKALGKSVSSLALLAMAGSAVAATFTYNPTSTPGNWSTDPAWAGGAPVSNVDTVLVYNPTGGTFPGAVTNSNTNDVANPFLLNSLTLGGAGPVLTGTPVVINILGNPLSFNTSTGLLDPVINLDANNGTGTSTVTYTVGTAIGLVNNTTIAGNGTGAFTFSGIISGAGNITKTGNSVLTLSGANTRTGSTAINGGTINISAANNLGDALSVTNTISMNNGTLVSTAGTYDLGVNRSITLNGAGTVLSNAGTLTLSGAINNGANLLTVGGAGNMAISGIIGNGAGGLTKTGAGTLSLTGANTYLGPTTINGGTVTVIAANSLGDATSVANAITIGGGATLAATTTFDFGVNRTVTLNGAATLSNTGVATTTTFSGAVNTAGFGLTVAGGGGTTITGVVSGVGGTLTKTGAGNLTLSAANTYSGLTSVTGGTLTYGASDAIGGDLTVNGGTVAMLGNSDTIATVTLTNGVISGTGGTLTATTLMDVTAGTISANLAGGAGVPLNKNGTGTVTLTGNNTFTGLTTVNNGVLNLGSAGALGGGGNVTFASTGGTVQYSALSAGVDLSSRIVNSTGVAVKIDVNGQTVNFASGIAASNTGGLTLTSTAANGILNLNAVQNYTGVTTVTSGTLQFGVANALSGPVTVAGGTLSLQAFNVALGAVILTGGSITGTGTLTTSAPAFDLQAGSVSAILGGGATAVTKTGSGTVVLTGVNTYGGGTNINAGTLQWGNANAFGTVGNITFGGGNLQVNATTAPLLNGLLVSGRVVPVSGSPVGIDTNNETITLTNAIPFTGTSGFTKAGLGTINLTVASNYAGVTTVSGGTLAITNLNQIGDGSASNTLAFSGGGVITLPAGNITLGTSRAIALTGTGGGFQVVSPDTLTIDGLISGAGNLTKTGSGSLTISGANVGFSGIVSFSGGGTLNFGAANNLGTNTTGTGLTMGTLATTTILNSTSAVAVDLNRGLTMNGPVTIQSNVVAAIVGTPPVSATTSMLRLTGVTMNGNSLTIAGPGNVSISGAMNSSAPNTSSVIMNGTGTLLLGASNNYNGGLVINSGVVMFSNNGGLGAATNAITLNGGVLANAATPGNTGTTRPITLTATSIIRNTDNSANTFNIQGALALGSNNLTIDSPNVQGAAGQTVTISNTITGSGTINKIGNGNTGNAATGLIISAAANPGFTGIATVTNGWIRLVTNNGLQAATLNLSNAGTALQLRNNAATTFNIGTVNITANVGIQVDRVSGATTGLTMTMGSFNVGANTITVSNVAASNYNLAMGVGTQSVAGTTTFTTGALQLSGTAYVASAPLTLAGFTSAAGGASTLAFAGSSTASVGTITQGAGNLLGLTKSGAGTLTLTAANGYSGVTTLNAGNTIITNPNQLGDSSATNTIAMGGGTLVTSTSMDLGVNRAVNFTAGTSTYQVDGGVLTLSGVLSGGGALKKTGVGTLLLTGGASLATGATTIANGIIQVDGGNDRLPTGNLTLGEAANSGKLVIGGTVAVNQTVGSVSVAGTGLANAIVGGNAGISTLTMNVASGTSTFPSTAIIGGAGTNENNLALTKTGNGTLVLAGTNTYTGGTNINGGNLQWGAANAMSTTGNISFGGGTLQLTAATGSLFNGLIASGRLTATGNNPFSIDTNGENLTVFNGTQITNAFPVIGTSGFTKNGAGTMELTVANTYAGVTTINGGELKITAANQIGNAALATNTIAVGGFGTSTLTTNGTFALGTNRSVSLSANAILNVESGNLTVDGNVTGSGGLIKTGFGTTLILTGSNSYGTTEINDGTVQVGNGGTTGSLGTGAVNNVGTLVFKRSNTLTVSSNITGTIGTVTNDGGATNVLNLNGSQDYLTLNTNAGTTNVNATIASLATVNANAGSKLNFSTNQTLMALNIGAGATVTMNAVAPFSEFSGPSTAAVPEPGSLGLLVVGALGMLARRRRS